MLSISIYCYIICYNATIQTIIAFKFRCPYEGANIYDYYDGKIYIQPFAPVSSTESRILFETKLCNNFITLANCVLYKIKDFV